MSIFTYGFRVNKILKDENATAYFTPREIVFATVNLINAKKSLTQEEFFFISVVFETYKRFKTKLLLSRNGFLELVNEIIAHFDLIAPYYKFCGDKTMNIMRLEENDKYKYRQQAKELLSQKAIFQNEWMALHKKFMEKFYF